MNISAREAEVLAAIGEHQTNAQIAERLHLSIRTVESHVSSLLRKVGVTDRRSLAATLVRQWTTLPRAATSFVGRTVERAELRNALNENRLVSLLGPGGVGKTRLAIETAPADAAFVDLVPVRAGFVTQAVASAVGAVERPGQPLVTAIVDRLGERPATVVVDNCEHVIDEVAPLVERILFACPDVTVLATSRERLGLAAEHILDVRPLGADAQTLLADRARAVDRTFAATPELLADVCERLDGIPLAIELAAARIGSLGMDGLRAALRDRLRLLAGGRGADQRHRSLRMVIGWSYDLLDPAERALFRRLSVFAGGFDLAAVTATNPEPAAIDVLGRLVDKSLVIRLPGGRWRMLETVRAFAAGMLAASDDSVRSRYLKWASEVATELENRLDGDWQDDFDAVADDLRAAAAQRPELALSLGHLTYARRLFCESLRHYVNAGELLKAVDVALAIAEGPKAYELLLAAAENTTGNASAFALAYAVVVTTRYPAGDLVNLPVEHIRDMFDDADSASDGTDPRTEAMIAAARAWLSGPDLDLAESAVRLARESGDPVLVLGALDALCTSLADAGRLRDSRRHALERMRIAEPLPGHDPYAAAEIIDAFHVEATTAISVGDLGETVGDDPTFDHPYLSLPRRIRRLTLIGRLDEAVDCAEELWENWQRAGAPPTEWMASAIAVTALAHGLRDDGLFELWRQRAVIVAADEVADLAAPAAFVDARFAIHTGKYDEAIVERAYAPTHDRWWQPYAHAAATELAVVAGLPDAEARLSSADWAAGENDWAAACVTRARGRLQGCADLLAESVKQWERIGAEFERSYTITLLSG